MKYLFKENNVETSLDFGELIISGDEAFGFRPFQLMVSSIVSCSGSVFKQILTKQRIDIDALSATAEVTRNTDEANRIERIEIIFHVTGSDLDQAKLEKSLAIARKNCSMIRSVEDSIQIEETIEITS